MQGEQKCIQSKYVNVCVLKSKRRDTSRDFHEGLPLSSPCSLWLQQSASAGKPVRWLGNHLPCKVDKWQGEKCNRGQRRIRLSFIFPRQERQTAPKEREGYQMGEGESTAQGTGPPTQPYNFSRNTQQGPGAKEFSRVVGRGRCWARSGPSRCRAALTWPWLPLTSPRQVGSTKSCPGVQGGVRYSPHRAPPRQIHGHNCFIQCAMLAIN